MTLGARPLFAALLISGLALLAGCGGDEETPDASIGSSAEAPAGKSNSSTENAGGAGTVAAATPRKMAKVNLFPEVIIKTSQGAIRVRLNAEKAPLTVDNFLANYVDRGFYAGTIIHYVEPGNMIAAGGFTSDYQGKETRAPIENEAGNGLKNLRGTIAMARDPQYAHSATSQFFINLVDNPSFDQIGEEQSEDFGYCVFGEVISGMEVVDAISQVAVHDEGDFIKTPAVPVVIESIEIVKR